MIRDSKGTNWSVEETGTYHGAGARGPGGAFPRPTTASVEFVCEDGRRVLKTLGIGQLAKATEEELCAVLEEVDDED